MVAWEEYFTCRQCFSGENITFVRLDLVPGWTELWHLFVLIVSSSEGNSCLFSPWRNCTVSSDTCTYFLTGLRKMWGQQFCKISCFLLLEIWRIWRCFRKEKLHRIEWHFFFWANFLTGLRKMLGQQFCKISYFLIP